MARIFWWIGGFLREFDRGLAVGYGHERRAKRKLREPEPGVCRRLDRRCRKDSGK